MDHDKRMKGQTVNIYRPDRTETEKVFGVIYFRQGGGIPAVHRATGISGSKRCVPGIGTRATDLYAPSGRRSVFSGHPCPEIADCDTAIRIANTFRKVHGRNAAPLSESHNPIRIFPFLSFVYIVFTVCSFMRLSCCFAITC